MNLLSAQLFYFIYVFKSDGSIDFFKAVLKMMKYKVDQGLLYFSSFLKLFQISNQVSYKMKEQPQTKI